jgi:hypothetical protein
MPFEKMLPNAAAWGTIKQQAAELIRTGFLPQGIKTPEQAVAIMFKGRELGIPPMQALAHIHVINGKPTMSSELMLSQIMRLHPRTKISYPVRSSERCEMKVIREGCEPSTFVFTIDDATKAGVMGNPTWKKYPRAMLHARCVSEMARSLFPDAISGVSYTPEEIGANVNENGEIIDVTPAEIQSPVVQNVVAETAPKTVSDPAAVITFDKTDKNHVAVAERYVTGKGFPAMTKQLCERLHGKAFRQSVIIEEFAAINPEAPDAPPSEVEL